MSVHRVIAASAIIALIALSLSAAPQRVEALPCPATSLSCPITHSGSLTSSSCVGAAGYYDVYNVSATAGQTLTIVVNSGQFHPGIALYSASGQYVGSFGSTTSNTLTLPWTIDTTGVWQIAVGTYHTTSGFDSTTGGYTVTVTGCNGGGTPATCVPSSTTLCLNNNRFSVTAAWQTSGGQSGQGQAVPLTVDTGYFTFFSASNIEVIIKVLNGCSLSSRYWVFAGGLTDVNVVLTVRDTVTGTTRTYTNPQGTAFKPIQDTDAFATCSASSLLPAGSDLATNSNPSPYAAPAPRLANLAACSQDATTLCLNNDRFAVSATWSTNGQSGQARAVRLTADTGYFTFFSSSNVEAVVKVLDACGPSSKYWVFAGGLTNVNVVLTVRDTATGTIKTYTNPANTAFQPIQDTSAFATCTAASAGTVFVSGGSTVVATQTVSPSGSTITIAGSGTPIDGAKIVIPAGALSKSATVKVSFNRGTVSPISGAFSGAALAIDVSGAAVFSQPLSITVPYSGGTNAVPVPYFADANGTLRPGQIISVDRQAGTFTFQTFHASLFTWLFALLSPSGGSSSAAYAPSSDGFQIVNTGSSYNREGECFGMTSFSLWYYLNQKSAGGKFYPKYMNVVGTDSDNKSIRGQNVIATRAFTSIAQKWTSYQPTVGQQQNLTPAERYASIQNIIANTGAPVLIYLYHSDDNVPGAHSVLAYSVENSSHSISLYDPNLPGTVQKIQYSTSTNTFNDYCNGACYDGIVYSGDGSLSLNEPYSNILADADNNFNNSGGATIAINSHTSGQVLTTRLPTLSGVVHSSQLLVTRLTVIVGSTEYAADVPLSGAFSIPIALNDGVNHIKFRTEGTNSAGALVSTSNNYDTKDFTLQTLVPSSVVLMTLTWDKNDTDVDTYVIDPTGDYSSFYHPYTADGGYLDQDITTGYGPEHWLLSNTDVVRYNQPYRFRVHYFDDHGNGPTNYTVTIALYSGTSRQVTYSYTGALAVSDYLNSFPSDTGPDWANIATVTLTQSGGNTVEPGVRLSPEGGLDITVPVPPPAERRKLKR